MKWGQGRKCWDDLFKHNFWQHVIISFYWTFLIQGLKIILDPFLKKKKEDNKNKEKTYIHWCILFLFFDLRFLSSDFLSCVHFFVLIIFTQPLHLGRIWHKINFFLCPYCFFTPFHSSSDVFLFASFLPSYHVFCFFPFFFLSFLCDSFSFFSLPSHWGCRIHLLLLCRWVRPPPPPPPPKNLMVRFW